MCLQRLAVRAFLGGYTGYNPCHCCILSDRLTSLVKKLVLGVENQNTALHLRGMSDGQGRVRQWQTSEAQSEQPRLPVKTPPETRGPKTLNEACWLYEKRTHLARQCQKGVQTYQGTYSPSMLQAEHKMVALKKAQN